MSSPASRVIFVNSGRVAAAFADSAAAVLIKIRAKTVRITIAVNKNGQHFLCRFPGGGMRFKGLNSAVAKALTDGALLMLGRRLIELVVAGVRIIARDRRSFTPLLLGFAQHVK